MSAAFDSVDPRVIVLHGGAAIRRWGDDEFLEVCRLNRDLRLERTAEGDLVIMPPTGGDTGRLNARFTRLLDAWAERDGRGVVFDSSTGFLLPNGARRSPDASWIERARWDALPAPARERFPPLCPDFVVEIRSPSDELDELDAKMREYVGNGAKLGWLLDPSTRSALIYRPDRPVEQLDAPTQIEAGEIGGFVLELARLW
jgi:Uma2 family endonuclease